MIHIPSPETNWWGTEITFSGDGRRVVTTASGGNWRNVVFSDVDTGKTSLTLTGHRSYVNAIVRFPDGKRIVTTSNDKTAKIWDATTGKEMLTLKGHGDYVSCAAVSPDGKRVVTGSRDKTARVWDAATGELLLTMRDFSAAVNSVDFSPDGKRIVVAVTDGTVRLYFSDAADADAQFARRDAARNRTAVRVQ